MWDVGGKYVGYGWEIVEKWPNGWKVCGIWMGSMWDMGGKYSMWDMGGKYGGYGWEVCGIWAGNIRAMVGKNGKCG